MFYLQLNNLIIYFDTIYTIIKLYNLYKYTFYTIHAIYSLYNVSNSWNVYNYTMHAIYTIHAIYTVYTMYAIHTVIQFMQFIQFIQLYILFLVIDKARAAVDKLREIKAVIEGSHLCYVAMEINQRPLLELRQLTLMHIPISITEDVRGKFEDLIHQCLDGYYILYLIFCDT